jgi:hypothetical protein
MSTAAEVVYPESDGKPMADNTLQWDWVTKIVSELREQYVGQRVFVAGDLFWYPVKGDAKAVAAPDALVAFGRPPGYRGSYLQWEEEGVAPQVVFEVLSPKNTRKEMRKKRDFYERHGVEEYYVIDPYAERYEGYTRSGDVLVPIPPALRDGHVSRRLGVTFNADASGFWLTRPDGRVFQTVLDRGLAIEAERRRIAAERAELLEREAQMTREAEAERRRADAAQARADAERTRADAEQTRADAERAAKERFAAKLRELGIDPDALT